MPTIRAKVDHIFLEVGEDFEVFVRNKKRWYKIRIRQIPEKERIEVVCDSDVSVTRWTNHDNIR